ncbi:receptor-like protein 18 [Macadamia integrifolia]|uniref:receptor-like protein 18 n=1 Tax=Macadamia integrifolia TaxID=60698 RepID=UPI001C52B7D2|nr:receptor-like protein 18 [Macadamia integrifolia]
MLHEQVPRSLAYCEELEVIDIGDNHLNNTFPYWLENLSKLWVLVMRSNNFGGPIGQFSHVDSPFPSLQAFDISFNAFTGTYHCNIFFIGSFEVSGYYYQDTIAIVDKGIYMEMRSILIAFTTIDLSNNKFSGEIPNALGSLESLILLNLSGNSLTGQIPSSLGNLRELESLDLSRNSLRTNPYPIDKFDIT